MPDFRSLLSAAAADAQPSLQPPFATLRARASRRAARRRTALALSAAAVVVIGSVAVAQGVGGGSSQPAGPGATPCASPFSGSEAEQSVAFPHDGETLEVTVPVFGRVTVGWSGCGEHGTISSSEPDGSTAPATATDISVYSSPRPVPSGIQHGCCARPQSDGVFVVRYTAQRPGTVTLRGTGSEGSSGKIILFVKPFDASDSRAVSGVVDTSALRNHPGAEFVQLQEKATNGRSAVALVSTDGTFSLRLPPGSYEAQPFSSAYNDGRVRCTSATLDVGASDVSGVTLVCTERS